MSASMFETVISLLTFPICPTTYGDINPGITENIPVRPISTPE